MIEENKLPKGWVQTTLGDLLPIQYGKGLVVASRVLNGEIPVYGSSGIVGFHNQALTTKPSLVIGRKGSIGSVYHSTVPCWPIDTTYFTEEDSNKNLKFFLHLLSFLDLHQFDKSTAIPGLSRDDYNALVVQVAPLPEQHRIVTAIEQQFTRLDAAVTALQHARTKLKRYRAAVLKAAVEGKLTEAWRAEHPSTEPASVLLERILVERRVKWEADQRAKGKYVEPARPDVKSLPELPVGWYWATVEQVTHSVKYGSSAKTSDDSSAIPVLRMGNIQGGYLDFSNLKYLPPDHSEFPGLLLEEGDLLFNRTNSAELVGKSAVYHSEFTKCSYASYLICVRTLGGCSTNYLCFFLNSFYGRKWVASVVTQQVGQANVNGSKLQALTFPLPPLTEQQQIVAEVERSLSIITTLEATVEANLKRAERLRQSILKEAFAGRLVPQDPNDEPASMLLERIRKEREEQKQGPIKKPREMKTISVPRMPDVEPVDIDASEMEQMDLWTSIGSRE